MRRWDRLQDAYMEQYRARGLSGVGKTHLAIALGTEAIVAGYSVYFATMQDLVTQFLRARDENKLSGFI